MERKDLITLAAVAVIIVAVIALGVVLLGHGGSEENNSKTITYHGNGGLYDGSDVFYSGTITAEPNRFVRQGYSFAGWNTKSDGTGDYYPEGKMVELGMSLYAQWTLNTSS